MTMTDDLSNKEKDRVRNRIYYYNIYKPRVMAFREWFRNTEPEEVLKFFNLKI